MLLPVEDRIRSAGRLTRWNHRIGIIENRITGRQPIGCGFCRERNQPAVPGSEVKTRLMASVGAGRFERFAARMATLFDVTIDRARELLGLAERGASWEAPIPGIGLVHFDGGPACATADCGFVRIAPGCTFPWHTHRGEEVSVILTGTLRDHEGRLLRPGDELVQASGSQHDISCHGDEEVIFVARAFGGIDVANKP